jgi:hypothetical protein
MILGRVTGYVKTQNWFAVGVELVILVLGVFIGIQVSNWNESRQEQQIAAGYLDRLRNDFRVESENYRRYINYYESVHAHAIDALEAFSRPADSLDVNFLVHLYQASQRWNLAVRRGTYDELLATGRIGLIEDEGVRAMLNNHYESSTSRMMTLERTTNPTYRTVIRMKMDENIQRQVRENCGDIYTVTDSNTFYLTLPADCEINVPADAVGAAIESLHADDEVRAELRFQLSEIESLLGSVRNGIRMNQSVLSELGGEGR